MSLDPRYIVGININDYFVDKTTGLPLSGGTISFFKDQDRSSAKLVYQLSGSPPNYTYTPLSDPITLSAVGTVVNTDMPATNQAIYYYPYDELGNIELYYIVVKDSNGVIQLERQAWPNITAGDDPTQTGTTVINQLQNPQFADVLFNADLGVTITTGGSVSNAVYDIAPNWFLKVSANADSTIIVSRTALAGSANIETNPPYQLEILPEGNSITALSLVQRLYNNPDIWSNSYLSASIVAVSLDGISHTIEAVYSPSVSAAATTIFSEATGATGYTRMQGTIQLAAGDNTDTGDTGYVDIIYVLPAIGSVAITSAQVAGLQQNDQNVAFEQQPVNMQKSLLFDYYNPLIQQVPVPSILYGWDFPVNPVQFNSPTMGALASQYLWDQLIGWQSVNSLITVSRTLTGNLNVNLSATGQFALIQYISGTQLNQLMSDEFSVLMEGYSDQVAGISGTVSFWYTTDAMLPNVAAGTNLSLVSAMDANGKPTTFHGNWTELTRNYRGDARFTVPYSAAKSPQSIALEGWNYPGYTIGSTATYAAIVVGFSSAPTSNVIFNSISVTPGVLSRPVAPLSYNSTLSQLQYFYEKSYNPGVYAGTVTQLGQLLRPQIVTANSVNGVSFDVDSFIYHTGNFGFEYNEIKISIPVVTLYSPITGASSAVSYLKTNVSTTDEAISNWTATIGKYSVTYSATTLVSLGTSSLPLQPPSILFHYTLDSRLGIVL